MAAAARMRNLRRSLSVDFCGGSILARMKLRASYSVLLPLLLCGLHLETPAAVPLTEEPSHHLFLQNEYVRVFKVEVAPHESTLMHQHDHDYVFVTLGDSQVLNAVRGKDRVERNLKAGEV